MQGRGTGGPWELALLMHVIVGVMGSMVWPGACMSRVRLPLDPSARQGGVGMWLGSFGGQAVIIIR